MSRSSLFLGQRAGYYANKFLIVVSLVGCGLAVGTLLGVCQASFYLILSTALLRTEPQSEPQSSASGLRGLKPRPVRWEWQVLGVTFQKRMVHTTQEVVITHPGNAKSSLCAWSVLGFGEAQEGPGLEAGSPRRPRGGFRCTPATGAAQKHVAKDRGCQRWESDSLYYRSAPGEKVSGAVSSLTPTRLLFPRGVSRPPARSQGFSVLYLGQVILASLS